jgi:hypothetical protein
MRIRGLIALTAVFGALLVPATAHAAVYDVHIFTVTLDSSGGLLIRGNLAGCPNGWTYKISGTVTSDRQVALLQATRTSGTSRRASTAGVRSRPPRREAISTRGRW